MDFELRPYQRRGVEFLACRESALLADEMGLGKSPQTLVAIQTLYAASPHFTRVLIVVPAGLITNWYREAAKFAPSLHVNVIVGEQQDRLASYRLPIPIQITSYESIRSDAEFLMRRFPFDLVVLDEAQRIKNADSRTALACRTLPRRCSWALTGTPLENRISDLAAIFRFLRPGFVLDESDASQLRLQIEPYFLRRRVSDVLNELPPVITATKYINLSDEQRTAYDLAATRASELGPDAPIMAVLAQVTKLKQICNFDTESGASAKLDVLRDILNEAKAEKKKILLFSQFVETLRFLQIKLDVEAKMYDGSLSASEKDTVVRNFKASAKHELLLISLRAGSVGLNLQEADIVIMFDRWWNPALENQAIGRAKRFGRLLPLNVVFFESVQTIEEKIVSVLHEKQLLFDEHIETLADSNVTTQGDLRNLLRIS